MNQITKAKWISGSIMIAVIVLMVSISKAANADTAKALASPHYHQALKYVPKGAVIIDIIETRESRVMYKGIYIKYDLNGSCYMIYKGNRHFGLTMDGCG